MLLDSNSRIFITIPRFSQGIPITLGYINSQSNDVLIKPYPDYSWHSANGGSCNQMTSVFRVVMDECDQMWVLDSGKIVDTNKVQCPPQLLLFNLKNDKLVYRYKFPSNQYFDTSLLASPVRSIFNQQNL